MMGRRADGYENKRLPVAEAGPSRAVRVRRVDAGQALAAFAVCGTEARHNKPP